MTNGKSTRQKLQDHSGRKCSFTLEVPAESAGSLTAESADYESMLPCTQDNSQGISSDFLSERPPPDPLLNGRAKLGDWIPAYLGRLSERGLMDFCPVETRPPYGIPAGAMALH